MKKFGFRVTVNDPEFGRILSFTSYTNRPLTSFRHDIMFNGIVEGKTWYPPSVILKIMKVEEDV